MVGRVPYPAGHTAGTVHAGARGRRRGQRRLPRLVTFSGSQSSRQDHHSSSSTGAPRVVTKNSRRPPASPTGPGSIPAPSIPARAAIPTAVGTSSTSKTRPVTRMTDASGRAAHQSRMVAVSTVACICQVGETGCAPGAGQPTRSQEQARPVLWPSMARWAPTHTGQPNSA
jgi:hypothetical protein